MNWKETTISLGTIKQNSNIKFKFVSNHILDILEAKPSCGSCTNVGKYNINTLELPITFKAGSIPKHLNGYQAFRKLVIVTYLNGEKETLTFTGILIK